jgi:phosphoesterase RecJ-like protein
MFRFFSTLPPNTSFLLCTHENPDIDGVCSLGILHLWLESHGYLVQSIIQPPIPGLDYLHGLESVFTDPLQLNMQTPSVLVSLDCATPQRIWPQIVFTCQATHVNIDHHIDNSRFGDHPFVDPAASSTAELLYMELRQEGHPIPISLLENCYAGILFDTGGFRYSNTTSTTFMHAMELVKDGVVPTRIAQHVFQSYSCQSFQALKCALENCLYQEVSPSNLFTHISYAKVQEHHFSSPDFEGIVDILRLHKNADLIVFVREVKPNEWKGSIRSTSKYSILDMAHSFCGGGHRNAAGFTFYGSYKELKDRVMTQIHSLVSE